MIQSKLYNFILILVTIFLIVPVLWSFLTHTGMFYGNVQEHHKKIPQWISRQPVAHRGLLTTEFPENTISSFNNAAAHGYAIELDVQLSKDGVPMVFHDNTLNRLTGKSGTIKDYTSSELAGIIIKGSDEGIPNLNQVLSHINEKVPILIEIKNYNGEYGKLEKAVYETVKDYHGDYAVISFDPHTLSWFSKNAPHILRGQLASSADRMYMFNWPLHKRVVCNHFLLNWKSKPDFIMYDVNDVPQRSVEKIRRFMPVMLYTIKNTEALKLAMDNADNVVFETIGDEVIKSHTLIR